MINISDINSLSAKTEATGLKSKKQEIPKGKNTMLIAKKKLLEMIELTGKDSGTLPILGAVLLEQKNGNLCFRWSNLSEMIEINEPIEGNGNWVLAVPKKILKESVQMLKGDKISVDIDVDTGRVKVSDGKIESTIKNCFPAEEFPMLPKRIETEEEEIETSIFLEGLKKVLFAVSRDENRSYLCGVHIEFSKDGLDFTATTGAQLANWSLPIRLSEHRFQFILPTKGVRMLLKSLAGGDYIKIRKNKEYVQFELDNVLETFHLEDLKFPKWRELISVDDSKEVVLDRKEFVGTLKTTLKIEPTARFVFDNQELTVIAENLDRRIEQKISYSGDVNISVGLNCKLLNEGIKQIKDSELRIRLKGKGDAITIKEGNYQYFLMPVDLDR